MEFEQYFNLVKSFLLAFGKLFAYVFFIFLKSLEKRKKDFIFPQQKK